jgi:hypothetical protein
LPRWRLVRRLKRKTNSSRYYPGWCSDSGCGRWPIPRFSRNFEKVVASRRLMAGVLRPHWGNQLLRPPAQCFPKPLPCRHPLCLPRRSVPSHPYGGNREQWSPPIFSAAQVPGEVETHATQEHANSLWHKHVLPNLRLDSTHARGGDIRYHRGPNWGPCYAYTLGRNTRL